MSQTDVPDVRVWTIVKADERDVGISDTQSETNYGMHGREIVIRTKGRVERSWKCWVRDEDTGEESWMKGDGDCPYREGHRVVLATYEGELLGQHNINMNKTLINNPSTRSANAFDVIFVFILCLVRCIFAPIAFLCSLAKVFYKKDGIVDMGPFPDSAKYTNKYGRYCLIPLALVMLSYLSGDVEVVGGAILAIAPFLTIISFKYINQGAKARAEFMAEVSVAIAKAARDDLEKSKSRTALGMV